MCNIRLSIVKDQSISNETLVLLIPSELQNICVTPLVEFVFLCRAGIETASNNKINPTSPKKLHKQIPIKNG